MIVALRSWRDIAAIPPLGPKARAVSLALGAVLLWATWPTLATWAQPAPPFLVLGLGAATGFALSLSRAAASGNLHWFVTTPPKTLALVAVGLLANNILYLMAMARIGPAEANVIAYLWPILLVMILSRLHRSPLTGGQWLGVLAAFVGAALAIGPTFTKGFDLLGVTLAFASGLVFAIYAAVRSHGQERQDVIGPGMGVVAVLSIALHFLFENDAALGLTQLLAIAAIGVAPLTLSNALWDLASRAGHTATISGIAYLTPLVSLLLLSLLGVTAVSWSTGAGALLIVGGALAASRA